MKTLKQIDENILDFEKKYGFKVRGAEQGSSTWLQIKLGVLSASNAAKIVAKRDSDTRWTYLYDLVAQVATGVTEELNSKHLEYGASHEETARTLYEITSKKKISPVTFIFKNNEYRCGISPDGLIVDQHGLELKVPFNPSNYVKFLCEDYIKSEWNWQCQFSMWVADSETWDFAQFSPVMKVKPLHIVSVKRDSEKMKVLDDLVPQFISDMDSQLKNIGLGFGSQWRRLA